MKCIGLDILKTAAADEVYFRLSIRFEATATDMPVQASCWIRNLAVGSFWGLPYHHMISPLPGVALCTPYI